MQGQEAGYPQKPQGLGKVGKVRFEGSPLRHSSFPGGKVASSACTGGYETVLLFSSVPADVNR